MEKKYKIILAIIALLLFSIYPLYQLYALDQVTIQNFQIHQIEMNNRLQFEIEGSLDMYNPSYTAVTIKQITYTATIDGAEVFTGTIDGTTIASQEASPASFVHTINWMPDEATVETILNGDDVIMVIETQAEAEYLYFFTLDAEKSFEINITQMVKPYIEEQMNAINNMLAGLLF